MHSISLTPLHAVSATNLLKLLDNSGLGKAIVNALSRLLRYITGAAGLGSKNADAYQTDSHLSVAHPSAIYADYAGAPPYSISALSSATDDLLKGVWSNPHSGGGLHGTTTAAAIDQLRVLTLDMCRADSAQYVCIFTSGATASLKLVAEAFPWSSASTFLHLDDNHNSVLGIREVAAEKGARTGCVYADKVSIVESSESSEESGLEKGEGECSAPPLTAAQHLFAFPLESNFSGNRYPEELVDCIQNIGGASSSLSSSSTTTKTLKLAPGAVSWHSTPSSSITTTATENETCELPAGEWRVLIDAAKACATQPPDLSTHHPDFVALSFYKIFGYPSGLGALLVRRDVFSTMMKKSYFGGGTVLHSSAEERFHALRSGVAGFEDGTLSFLSVPAVLRGFEVWRARGGLSAVCAAAQTAATRLAGALMAMQHGNGAPVCVVYGQWPSLEMFEAVESAEEQQQQKCDYSVNKKTIFGGQGPTVTFNLLDSEGGFVGHQQVHRIASLEGIFLRTGMHCNPGGARAALGIASDEAKDWFLEGHVCWDDRDVIGGKPTGAVRASFGWASTLSDAECIADFVQRHFVVMRHSEEGGSSTTTSTAPPLKLKTNQCKVHSLHVYPIKSAAGFSPRSWPLGASGLLYDRHWAVVDVDGQVLTQRRCPLLAKVKAVVDVEDAVLRVHCAGSAEAPLEIALSEPTMPSSSSPTAAPVNDVDVKLCLRREPASSFTSTSSTFDEASRWFSQVLGVPCRLVEHASSTTTTTTAATHEFSNEAQFLILTTQSVAALQRHSGFTSIPFDSFATRFRPNLIIENGASGKTGGISTTTRGDDDDDDTEEDAVVDSVAAAHVVEFEEETWSSIVVEEAGTELTVVGPCSRCEMVCIDPLTGRRVGSEPLLTLAKQRRGSGKKRLCFGVLVNFEGGGDEKEEQEQVVQQVVGTGGVKRQRRFEVGMHVACS